ncbi:hypothetical protein N665_0246s0017 [Sinapis alba]|nr:hypothetical protein N665_0246s0017 [Sinapis alba]
MHSPDHGACQSSDVFWFCVMKGYGNGRKITWCERTKRSMQSLIQTIEKATKKLHACIRQCENRRPSDKITLSEDPQFKTSWKFDHVWNMIKNFEKFMDGSTSPNDHVINSPTQILQIINGFSSQRPSRVKRSKMKSKLDDQSIYHMEIQKQNHTLKEENKVLLCDLSSIQDLNVRAYIQAQQVQIISKRNAESQDQQALS